ncbi:hypothetical protein HK105_206637 [Polyrhizophydium stewartii]|uniref:Uncharacterized protein n=1 Tax=Polyrhizophydium stewartii TaxID=2732419 RepID=A0ABR4N316_9FUNG
MMEAESRDDIDSLLLNILSFVLNSTIMGFFDQDPLTYFVRPRFQLNIEYFALVFEIAGLVSVLANCVFLIGKLRKAPTGFLLRGLLAISILISIFIFANILLLYVTFSLSTLTVTTWSLTAAQVLLISIETEAIKVFVPGLPEWIIYVLRGINTALAVALGLPQFFRGPIFTNPADPGVYTTVRMPRVLWLPNWLAIAQWRLPPHAPFC